MSSDNDSTEYKRFSISLPGKLLDDFDTYITGKRKLTRSDAIRKAMRKFITDDRWADLGGGRVGSITILLSHGQPTTEHHIHGDVTHAPIEHDHAIKNQCNHEHSEAHSDLLKSNEIEHMFKDVVVSTLHVHLDDDRCLEIIAVRGAARRIKELYDNLVALKGIEMHDFSIIS